MNAIALDPGKQTGVATFYGRGHRAFGLPAGEAMPWLHAQLGQEPPDLVVSESIHITRRSSDDILISVEQIGIARYLCHCYGVEFALQSPSEGKSFGTDNKLRALDWWTTGTDHARDASRHLITALAKRDAGFRDHLVGRMGAEEG